MTILPHMKIRFARGFASFLAGFVLLSAPGAIAQTLSNKIDRLMEAYDRNQLFQGTILVAKSGTILFQKSYGMANREWNIPNSLVTKYRLASVSKQFTALIVLQLASEGKLDLQAPITRYLPEYRKDTGDKVTVHHLLTHTSGIPNGPGTPGFWSRSEHTYIHYSTHDVIEKFASGDLEFEPGSKFKYSSMGYVLLGAIIESVTGKPFAQVFHERITTPLDMRETEIDDNYSIVPNRATGYARTSLGWKAANFHYMPMLDGAGSVITSAADLLKYERALSTDKLLKPEYSKLLYLPHVADADHFYGYGWEILSFTEPTAARQKKLIFHGGNIRGFAAYYGRIPEDEITVIILSNADDVLGILNRVGADILSFVYGGKGAMDPKVPVRFAVGKSLMDRGAQAAIAAYGELKTDNPETYIFNENELNIMGYDLLSAGRIQDAIEIFLLNTREYPASGNVFDSLGEAYMIAGDKQLAIENYRKSLSLNPSNENAKEMLKKLQ